MLKLLPFLTSVTSRGLLASLLLVFALAMGCNRFDPSSWDQKKMADEIVMQWKKFDVASAELTPTTGGFEGTAKATTGETFKVTITTDRAAKSASGTGVGDRGTELEFSVRAQ